MGAVSSCCKGGHAISEEDHVKMTEVQRKAGLAAQQRPRRVRKTADTEEDRAKAAEAKYKAGLAAQQRAEAFEKSAGGRAARKAAAEAAKPSPPPGQRGEPGLRWQLG